MYLDNSFGKSLDILHRSMDVNLLRQRVIADNIANADTPNFKRTTVNFETMLASALDSERADVFPARLTHERHMPFHEVRDYRSVQPRLTLDYLTTSKNNGNNVDIEVETSNFITAQLQYNLMVQSVTGQFNNLNLVLRG